MKQHSLIISALATLVVVGAIVVGLALWPKPTAQAGETPVNVSGGAYTDVSPHRLAEMLAASRKDFVFINTHIPYDREIEGTDDFIPFDQIEQSLDRLPADKSAKIVLYCRSGNMSVTAAETLVRLGYTNVWNLAGGMKAWRAAGFTLVER